MTRRSRRTRTRPGLSPEDRAVWERVVQSVTPLVPEERPSVTEFPAEREEETPRRPAAPDPAPRRRGTGQPTRRPAHGNERPGEVGRPEPGLDRRTAERLRRGEREPDARIDLHGLTAARAHRALDRFLGEAVGRGHRLVLVITGKGGRPGAGEEAPFMRPDGGVLREAAPKWLRGGPHAARIVGIYAAHRRHGGAGAFYVYLKKPGGR